MSHNVLLLASEGAEATRVAEFCRIAFPEVQVHHGDWGQPLPEACGRWRGDIIISYCSRWVVPDYLLEKSRVAINFHPAPPAHPGIGGLNWALYNEETKFGVTAHHMVREIDAGKIIEVREFPIFPKDSAVTLFERTHAYLEVLALDILGKLAACSELSESSIKFSSDKRSRKQLNDLATIDPQMSPKEIARRVRATAFRQWQPTVDIGGHTFKLVHAESSL